MLQSSHERSAPLTYNAAGLVTSDSLVRQYSPLVKRIAHHMIARLPASVQIDDLVQAGMMGLLDAASRFDEAQGIQFETFAAQRIRGAMLGRTRESDWLPRSARKAQRAHRHGHAEGAAARTSVRRPSRKLAREMNVPLAQYQQLLSDARGSQLVHIDELQGDDDESFFERNLPDDREEPSARLADKRFRRRSSTRSGRCPSARS